MTALPVRARRTAAAGHYRRVVGPPLLISASVPRAAPAASGEISGDRTGLRLRAVCTRAPGKASTTMNCRTCGHSNPADARFCGACGAALERGESPVAPPAPPSRRPPRRVQPAYHRPLTAALLNAVPFPIGLGYVYLGRWGRVMGSLFARCVGFVLGVTFGASVLFSPTFYPNEVAFAFAAFLAPQVAILALTAWDAWRVADDPGGDVFASRADEPPSTSRRRTPSGSVAMEVANLWRG